MTNVRAAAVRSLLSVLERKCSLNEALDAAAPPLQKELTQGVARWYWRLRAYADRLLQTPLRSRDTDVMVLILVGIYQLGELRVPAHAAINETVAACSDLGKGWAKGLVNAVLRAYQRRSKELAVGLSDEDRYSHPAWMLQRVRRAWPSCWREILEANNQRPPMVIRVNRQRLSRAEYLERLARCGLAAAVDPLAPDALVLDRPVPVGQLPGFGDGWVSVQDTAAQWTADILPVSCGHRVLDACAAPGGKLTHILERYPGVGEVVALDISAARAQLIEENLGRLGLTARVAVVDAADLPRWWDGKLFDHVVVDAPCSGTGVIRRRPDIKHLRREEDVAPLVARQAALLDRLWRTLAPRGYLLYITCSVLPEENEQQVEHFLSRRSDAKICATGLPTGRELRCGTQTLPGVHGVDGFYYSLMQKADTQPANGAVRGVRQCGLP